MLQMPQRSVTRFFIPLIDVLILLFSLFLVLMVLQKNVQARKSAGDADLVEFERLKAELEKLRVQGADIKALEEQIAQLQRQLAQRLKERLVVRVLEIDPADGRLIY